MLRTVTCQCSALASVNTGGIDDVQAKRHLVAMLDVAPPKEAEARSALQDNGRQIVAPHPLTRRQEKTNASTRKTSKLR